MWGGGGVGPPNGAGGEGGIVLEGSDDLRRGALLLCSALRTTFSRVVP